MAKLRHLTQALPPAGDWRIDPGASTVAFCGRAGRLAPTVRARFSGIDGALHLAADPSSSTVDVALDVRTMTTGNAVWDDMLRQADPFRARTHPVAAYRSTRVRWDGDRFAVTGELHLGGTRTALDLSATVTATATGSDVRLEAAGAVDPRAAGIRLCLPGAGLLLPRSMNLSIAVTASRASSASRFALAS